MNEVHAFKNSRIQGITKLLRFVTRRESLRGSIWQKHVPTVSREVLSGIMYQFLSVETEASTFLVWGHQTNFNWMLQYNLVK